MELFIILFLVGIIFGGIIVLSVVSQRFSNVNYIPRTYYPEGEGRGVGGALLLLLLMGVAIVIIYNAYNSDPKDSIFYDPNEEVIMEVGTNSSADQSETRISTIQDSDPEQVFEHTEIAEPEPEDMGVFGWQVESFHIQSNARRYLEDMIQQTGYDNFIIIEGDQDGAALYKVVAIGFASKDAAKNFARVKGIKGFVVSVYKE